MDATTRQLVDFALASRYDGLRAGTVHACKRGLLDAFASALGAYNEPLSVMARTLAQRQTGTPDAGVWGSTLRTTPEAAAFTNGVMVRYLDVSDTYLGRGGSHPSDVLAGLLAVGEAVQADGRSVINAMTVAYDVYCSLNDAIDIGGPGWDQPLYGVLGTALGAGLLLGLTHEQLGNAVSLALTPNMALRETRNGDLSSWKGCAGANAARNAVFAATLAQAGFTGPPAVFEGRQGLWNVLGRFEWPLPAVNGAPRMIEQTHIKSLPICYHGQSAALCALQMRSRVRVADIAEIHVEAYRGSVAMMGGDASRWAPTTRETADHSMPYVIAIALLDGAITSASFAPERLCDPAVVGLMQKVKVSEDPALTALYPESAPGRVTLRTVAGELVREEMRYPTGHALNPVSDAAVEVKFRDLAGAHGDARWCDAVIKSVWRFEEARDVGDVLARLTPQQ